MATYALTKSLFLLKLRPVEKIINYLKEVRLELSKVVWPKREEVIRMTSMVIVISAIVALYVGGLDYTFTKLLEGLLSR